MCIYTYIYIYIYIHIIIYPHAQDNIRESLNTWKVCYCVGFSHDDLNSPCHRHRVVDDSLCLLTLVICFSGVYLSLLLLII